MNHKNLFRSELEKFDDEILMLVSFKNEKNIDDLKQSSYFMFTRDRKVMNEILDSFVVDDQVKKVSLRTIFSAFSSAFVV